MSSLIPYSIFINNMKSFYFLILFLTLFPAIGLSEQNTDESLWQGSYKNGKIITKKDLETILKKHQAWLTEERIQPAWGRDIRRYSLAESNIQGVKLSGVNLSMAILTGANLSNSNLSGVNFEESNLINVNLTGSNLNNANLKNTDLYGAILSGADLSGARLDKSIMVDVNIANAKFNGTTMEGVNFHPLSSKVSLCLADCDLSRMYASSADLMNINFTNSILRNADLSHADLTGAKLINTDLSGANLSNANLTGADLTGAILNEDVNLTNSIFWGVNLTKAQYEAITFPNKDTLSGITGLSEVRFEKGKQRGIILLRNILKEVGLIELEREATYVIEKGKTKYSPLIEQIFRRIFFEWTCAYGMNYGKPLLRLIQIILICSIIYLYPIAGKGRKGIYMIWSKDRIDTSVGNDDPERLIAKGGISIFLYAMYFSILSAFHFGWRDLNVGNWIARIQPREYSLRATGWVRTVSGVQSLICIYLVAIWVLTYFGRPFE